MVKEKFIGTWKLVAVEMVYANEERIPTFKNPQGILIYEANDIVALQISGEYTDKVLDKSTLPVTDESKKNIPTFRAYWGKYKIDEEKQTISHHILGGSEHISSPQEEREFVFKGEYLILQMKDKPWLPNGSAVQVTWCQWH
jgi:hypothetical protein